MSWPLACFLLVGIVLVLGWLAYERARPSARMVAVVATLAAVAALTTPALADDVRVGVGVGPVGAGVTVGSGHRDYDRDRDRTTVIREREPSERTTVIKKDHGDGTRTKTIIHDRD